MNLLEIIEEFGLEPHKTSSSKGGTYSSSCPNCGGEDRFIIWSENNRYWCRQCKMSGDTIQFCRDFLNLSFQQACEKSNWTYKEPTIYHKTVSFSPPSSWAEKAYGFVQSSHQRLLVDPTALNLVQRRGLSIETIKEHLIGWNPISTYPAREAWGLEKKIEDGQEKKLLLPPGIVIPSFHNKHLCKVKIRRHDWQPDCRFGKYYIVPGSIDLMPLYGSQSHPVTVIVEAEFDAMLVKQEAGTSCSCLSLGGASKRPDESRQVWLKEQKLLLFALDFDDAGKNEYSFWKSMYTNLEPWPVPEEKSPGDYFIAGGNVNNWIEEGITFYRPSLSS